VLAWVLVGVLLGAGGVAVLAAFTVRLWRQVRQLGRDVAAASDRITVAADELSRVAPPPR
jgi:hypothetical protein